MNRKDFLKTLLARTVVAVISPLATAAPVQWVERVTRPDKTLPDLPLYPEGIGAVKTNPQNIELGKKAATTLLENGFSHVIIADCNHSFFSPREIAMGALEAVKEKHTPCFFGIELEDSVLNRAYNPDGKVNKTAVRQMKTEEYPKGYDDLMIEMFTALKQPDNILIGMDTGMDKNSAHALFAAHQKINQLTAAGKKAGDPEYDAAALAVDQTEQARLIDSCTIWPKNITTKKGKAKNGIILGGLGHFEGQDMENSCKVQESLEAAGIKPIGRINLNIELGSIAPSTTDFSVRNGVIAVNIQDENALQTLEESRIIVQKNATTTLNALYYVSSTLSSYAEIFSDTTVITPFKTVESMRKSKDCSKISNAITELDSLLSANPKMKNNYLIVLAKEALDKAVALEKEHPTPVPSTKNR